jgi:hypothetical protein
MKLRQYTNRTRVEKPLFFALKLLILGLIISILDLVIGTGLKHFYFKQTAGPLYRTTHAMEEAEAGLVIFGSSRATHHYKPVIFENRFGLSYYNAGRDGNFIFYHYAVLKCFLKRYKPKVVLLEFGMRGFEKNQVSYDGISSLLPYYNRHPEIRDIVKLKSSFEEIKLVSKIYPFNSSVLTIAAANINSSAMRDRLVDYKGYLPLLRKWNRPIGAIKKWYDYELDSNKIKFYEAFLHDCIASNVKIYIICSPYFIKPGYKDKSIELAKEIAKKQGLTFYDYSSSPVFVCNPRLFSDINHLNDSGATVFSNIVAKDILKSDPASMYNPQKSGSKGN